MIRAIILDLDGTLLNTLQDLTASVNYALSNHDMPILSANKVRQFLGNGVRRLMTAAIPDGEANPRFADTFADFKTHYVSHCLDQTRPYDGILDMLSTLHSRRYKLAIVSNKLQAGVTELHRRFFADTIDVAIGERQGIRRKPAADMVFEAMRQLRVQPDETIYVGDSEVDIATARAAGLPCIAVLWGFRDREQLTACGATHLAATPDDILKFLIH